MALIDEIPRARHALGLARRDEADRIAEAMRAHRVVGILGEAEVGKTETIRQALDSAPEPSVIRLDLDDAASEEHLAFHLIGQIAKDLLGASDFAMLKGSALGPPFEAHRVALAELLGVDGLDETLRDWPSGQYPLTRALTALEDCAAQRTTTLWIDHLEAPGLTPRHPLDVDQLLWGVREMAQRIPNLHIVLSGRDATGGRILGPEAAFHQQGRWLSLDYPSSRAWQKVAIALELSKSVIAELEELTEGHPATMLLSCLSLIDRESDLGGYEMLQNLAAADAGLVARAKQHARSLHRLGSKVLTQVANGEGPYAAAQRGTSPPQEIRKALEKLRLAGLLRHANGWSVLNPLVRIALRGQVVPVTAPDWELDSELDPEEI